MKKINILHVFNDLNGIYVYKLFDIFENNKKADESDYVRFTR